MEALKEITILPGVDCCESLDIIKSVPEFVGTQETYVSWRQSAKAAYKVFEPFKWKRPTLSGRRNSQKQSKWASGSCISPI